MATPSRPLSTSPARRSPFSTSAPKGGGGPSNATQTLATQSYKLSFANFEFGQGAALGNVLVLVSVVFAVVYLRLSRSGEES